MKKITGPQYARRHATVLAAQTTAGLAIFASALTTATLYARTDHLHPTPAIVLAASTLTHHLLDRTRQHLDTRAEHALTNP